MFRLLPSGLPDDPSYPADLKGLGYFINEEDEIRSIENPRAYFKYFLTKNERCNDSQREAMHTVIRETIYDRLGDLGLQRVHLPLGVSETDPHVPIFVSSDLFQKKRVIILFYEHNQDLGVLAIRVIGGRGGINQGSVINMIKYIQSLRSAGSDDPPGIILANLGQLRWWRRGKRAVTQMSWFALPQKSAVHSPFRFDTVRNTVPQNRSTEQHVEYIMRTVTAELCDPNALLSVIGVSEGAMQTVACLNKAENWSVLGSRMEALALLAPYYDTSDLGNMEFVEWLRKRGRVYIKSPKDIGVALNSPSHKSNPYGCPVYSLGEPYYNELMLPKGYRTIIDWFQDVARAGERYENPDIVDAGESEAAQTEWIEVEAVREEGEKGLLRTEGDVNPAGEQEDTDNRGGQNDARTILDQNPFRYQAKDSDTNEAEHEESDDVGAPPSSERKEVTISSQEDIKEVSSHTSTTPQEQGGDEATVASSDTRP